MRLHDKAMRRVAMYSLGLAGFALAAPAAALDVFVRAAPYTETMPDGTSKTMWGYRVGNNANAVSNPANPPASPGAAIRIPDNDSTLKVTLINNLPVPTSFVLHGHNTTMVPVFAPDATALPCTPPAPGTTAATMTDLQAFRDCRVRSFTHEAAPGSTAVYTYTNLKPGTYMYQSGTMPQIQVPMGLYGVVRKDAPPPTPLPGRNAYPNITYDNDITILLSEVDPALLDNVGADGLLANSTIGYDPKYFRLHRYAPTTGNCSASAVPNCITQPTPFTESSAQSPLPIQPGQRQLVRVVNAGLQSRALELIDGHWYLVAEEGNRFQFPREQYSALLPAAKTADFWFTPTVGDDTSTLGRQLTIFDRRMALTNNNADPSGGQLVRLNVGTPNQQPQIDGNCFTPPKSTGTQGLAYTCTVTSTNNMNQIGTRTFALDTAPAGMAINATSGVILWTPTNAQAFKPLLGQTVSNPVLVRVTGANGRSDTRGFSVAVTNTNDAPVPVNDTIGVRLGVAPIPIASLLANDSDPDGDALTGFANSPSSAGSLLRTGDTLTYTEDAPLPTTGFVQRTFTYTVSDGTLTSAPATVVLTVFANSAPVAANDVVSTGTATVTYIDVLANDTDIDGNLDPATLAVVGAPNHNGLANPVISANCPMARPCIEYNSLFGFRGSETFTYTVSDALGAKSQAATVTVNTQ